jgi:uncharacterized protein with PIN domain
VTTVTFRFFAELNDFLSIPHRHQPIEYTIQGNPSVKDAIEALGVPHTEVALIHINHTQGSFETLLQEGDIIAVYPAFTRLMPDGLSNPFANHRPDPLRFIADIHLGKLAAWLRMLGFDTAYGEEPDEVLAARSRDEQRVLLTRDVGLLKRGQVQYGYYVRATDPDDQIIEVLLRFQCYDSILPFQRCSHCNGLIQPVSKSDVESLVPPAVYREQDVFRQCQSCGQVYWKGSHYDRLVEWMAELKDKLQTFAPSKGVS